MKEDAPVGSPAGNGVVERGVQTIECQIRILKNSVEERLSMDTPGDHNITGWMVEFASVLNGRTLHERARARSRSWLAWISANF